MLKFLDSSKEVYGSIVNDIHEDPLRTTHNGRIGSSDDKLLYIKNDEPTLYYTNVVLSPVSSNYDDIGGEWSETGFGVKLLYGEARPTETEWDQVASGEPINLPDIGSTDAADIANYYPFWLRVICPGMTAAQIKKTMSLTISSQVSQVGS